MATTTIDWDDDENGAPGLVEDPSHPRRLSSAISEVSSSVGKVGGGGGSSDGGASAAIGPSDPSSDPSLPKNTLSTPLPRLSGRITTAGSVHVSPGGDSRNVNAVAGGGSGPPGSGGASGEGRGAGEKKQQEEEEEDPDLARARAAALAIASNPNLRPEDLMRLAKPDDAQKKLVDGVASQQQQQKKKKKGPLGGLGGLQQHLQGNIEKALQESGIQLPPALAKLQQNIQHSQQGGEKVRESIAAEKNKGSSQGETKEHQQQADLTSRGDLESSQQSLSYAASSEQSVSSVEASAQAADAPAKKAASQPPLAALGKGLVKNWKGLGGLGAAIDKMEEKENSGGTTPRVVAQSAPPGGSPPLSPMVLQQQRQGKSRSASTDVTLTQGGSSDAAVAASAARTPTSPQKVKARQQRQTPTPPVRGKAKSVPVNLPDLGKCEVAVSSSVPPAAAAAAAPVPTTDSRHASAPASVSPAPTQKHPALPTPDPEVLKSRIVGIDASGETRKKPPAQDVPDSGSADEKKEEAEGGTKGGKEEGEDGDGRPPVRLSALAWKRRTGLGGKLRNPRHAWERRRIELRGTKLAYFKNKKEADEDDAETSGAEDFSERSSAATPREGGPSSSSEINRSDLEKSESGGGAGGGGGGGKPNWWERTIADAQDKLTKLAADAQNAAATFDPKSVPHLSRGGAPSDPNAPRGEIDLVEENATAAATRGHSGAPTPFCVSIKIKGDTLWKFSFGTQAEQMEWLAALTDVVVGSSVGAYNEGLVEVRRSMAVVDGGAVAGALASMPAGGEEAIDRAAPGGVAASAPAGSHPVFFLEPPKGASDKRGLWKMDGYKVKSIRGLGGESSDEEEEEESDEEEEGEETRAREATLAAPEEASVSLLTTYIPSVLLPQSLLTPASGPKWTLDGDNLNLVIAALNLALLFCRASSTTREGFWMALTLVNSIVWLGVRKQAPPSPSSALVEETGKAAAAVGKKKKKRRSRKGDSLAGSAPSRPTEKTAKAKLAEKPIAGSTSVRVKETTERPLDTTGKRLCPWRALPGSEFQVRSHGYLRTKKKIPAPGELYKLVAVDAFESGSRYPNMADRVQLPKVQFNDDGSKNWHSPDIFVVSLSIPTEAPKMGRPTEDGFGYTVTMYYVMREETRAILRRINSPEYDPSSDHAADNDARQRSTINAVRLFDEWCRRAPTDPKFFARFKFLPMGNNLKEIGMPGWILKYNGKPVLIKRCGTTGFIYDHPDKSAMEFDISIHPFPYLAKQGTAYMKDNYFKDMLASFSFIIEGREDSELPEALIGEGAQLVYPDPQYAIKAEDWFAGKGPKPMKEEGKQGEGEEESTEMKTTGGGGADAPAE